MGFFVSVSFLFPKDWAHRTAGMPNLVLEPGIGATPLEAFFDMSNQNIGNEYGLANDGQCNGSTGRLTV